MALTRANRVHAHAFTLCAFHVCVLARAFAPPYSVWRSSVPASSRNMRGCWAGKEWMWTLGQRCVSGLSNAAAAADVPNPTPPGEPYNLTEARLAGAQRRLRAQNLTADDNMLRSVSRSKLTPQDYQDYQGNGLFCQFAQILCQLDGVVPRKELHEAWEAALLIHAAFPATMRIADLASGNGLLSWALLVLDKTEKRSVLCVDKIQPPSFVRIANAMIQRWPSMRSRHRYVEASIFDRNLKPQADVLLVCLHGCGTISDRVLEMALSVRAPLALVPCCHTTKNWQRWRERGLARPLQATATATLHPLASASSHQKPQPSSTPLHPSPTAATSFHTARRSPPLPHGPSAELYTDEELFREEAVDVSQVMEHLARLEHRLARRSRANAFLRHGKTFNHIQFGKAAAVDQARKQTLRAQGYQVRFDKIPEDITPRNRVILALPPAYAVTCAQTDASCSLWHMWTRQPVAAGATVWQNRLRLDRM